MRRWKVNGRWEIQACSSEEFGADLLSNILPIVDLSAVDLFLGSVNGNQGFIV